MRRPTLTAPSEQNRNLKIPMGGAPLGLVFLLVVLVLLIVGFFVSSTPLSPLDLL